jgi:hypothetical protein
MPWANRTHAPIQKWAIATASGRHVLRTLQGFLVIIKRFNRILPKKLPNPWILRNFTKILLKNLFYQISIKIVEILPKVKKYTEYGHTEFVMLYEWGHAIFYLASDQYEPKTRFWLLFKGSLNMFWSLRCRHFVYQFLLSTVNREPGDLNHSCSFQVYQKVALTVVWKRKAQQKTMLEERNVH